MNRLTGYLGTYASPESLGIYRFTLDLDRGSLGEPELYYNAPDSKYLSMDGSLLASSVKRDGRAGICLLDTSAQNPALIGESFQEEGAACYVTQDGKHVCTANYHEGTVLVYEKDPEGPRLLKRIETGPRAGCHQILFHGPYMLVPCLLLDAVKVFDWTNDFSPAGEIKFPKGTGPRHGVFDRDHRRLFLVSELSNEVYVYEADPLSAVETSASSAPSSPGVSNDGSNTISSGGSATHPGSLITNPGNPGEHEASFLHLHHVYPILPREAVFGDAPASAAVRLSPDERFLYVSTRFADVITVFSIDGTKLVQVQQTGCGGVHPRDFIITPDGSHLLCANRTQGGLVCFRLDRERGRILQICSRVPAPEAVSIVLTGPTD